MKLVTRVASEADKSAIWALYQDAMKSPIELIWGWNEDWQVADFAKAFSASATYVIDAEGEFGGYYQLDIDEREVYLRMIVLAPEVRSAGIGSVLLPELHRRSQQIGRSLGFRVFRVNHAARRFYERLGWQIEFEEDVYFKMAYAGPLVEARTLSLHKSSPQQFALAIDV
jgi:ribosomal protein S18 acetylase RimI-like enzyme